MVENNETRRCGWDALMCTPPGHPGATADPGVAPPADPAGDELRNLTRELCYYTGQWFFDKTQEFKMAARKYTEAYERLATSLHDYEDKWRELDKNFFRSEHWLCKTRRGPRIRSRDGAGGEQTTRGQQRTGSPWAAVACPQMPPHAVLCLVGGGTICHQCEFH